jgi:hypothetical protein
MRRLILLVSGTSLFQRVIQALREPLEPLAHKVPREYKDLLVRKALRALQGLREPKVLKAILEIQALLDQPALKARKEILDQRALLVLLERKVFRELQVRLDLLVVLPQLLQEQISLSVQRTD